MKRKIGLGLFFLFIVGQLSLPVFSLAAAPITGLEKVSEFKAENLLDLLNNKIDLKSFLGKPVKIPLTFSGEEADSLYLIPPQFFVDQKTQKITVTPTRTIYLADGKNISNEKIRYVRDELEKELNKIMNEKKDLLDKLRAVILNQSLSNEQLQAKFKELKLDPNQSSWIEWLLPFVKAEDSSNIDMGALQDLLTKTQSSTGAATESLTQEDALAEIVSSDNTKSRELLSLLLLLLIYKNAIAEADNTDKTTCVTKGGEWVSEQCVYPEEEAVSADEKNICSESGGEWKTDFSQRKICMASCDATDDDCTEKIVKDEVSRSGCICPTDQCVTAAGDCATKSESSKDKDEDEIPDSSDKCPSTKDQGDGVNMNESSADYGCSCADLQAKGRIQQRQCPGGGCEGAYLVQYNQSSGTDSCQNGVVSQFNCVANRYPSQQCQQTTQNNNNNQNQNQNSNSWQDMLKDLMGNKNNGNGGGQQGGGQQGGGDQGGGDQKSGCSSCGPQESPGQQQKPGQQQQTSTEQKTQPVSSMEQFFQGKEALSNVQGAINDFYKSGEGVVKNPEDASKFSNAMDEFYKNNPGATKEQVREAANQWISDNLAPGDKVPSAERAEMYNQIGKATTGGAATGEEFVVDRGDEKFKYNPDGSTTVTRDGETKTYDKDGKEIPGPTAKAAESGWDTAAGAGGKPPFRTAANTDNLTDDGIKGDPSPVTGDEQGFWDKYNQPGVDYNSKEFTEDAFKRTIFDESGIGTNGETGFKIMAREAEAMRNDPSLPPLAEPYVGTPGSGEGYNDTNFGSKELEGLEKYYTGLGMSPEEITKFIEKLVKREPSTEGDDPGAKKEEQEAPEPEGGEPTTTTSTE